MPRRNPFGRTRRGPWSRPRDRGSRHDDDGTGRRSRQRSTGAVQHDRPPTRAVAQRLAFPRPLTRRDPERPSPALSEAVGRGVRSAAEPEVARQGEGSVGVSEHPCTWAPSMPTSKSIQHAATWRRSWGCHSARFSLVIGQPASRAARCQTRRNCRRSAKSPSRPGNSSPASPLARVTSATWPARAGGKAGREDGGAFLDVLGRLDRPGVGGLLHRPGDADAAVGLEVDVAWPQSDQLAPAGPTAMGRRMASAHGGCTAPPTYGRPHGAANGGSPVRVAGSVVELRFMGLLIEVVGRGGVRMSGSAASRAHRIVLMIR